MSKQPIQIYAVSHADWRHPQLAISAARFGAIGLLDLEFCHDPDSARRNWRQLLRATSGPLGLICNSTVAELANELIRAAGSRRLQLVLSGTADQQNALARVCPSQHSLIATICTPALATQLDFKPAALMLKGNEAGGWVGEPSSLILAQQLAGQDLPVYLRGGIGLHSSAGCRAAGLNGVVLDEALLLLSDSPLTESQRKTLGRLAGNETLLFGDPEQLRCRAYAHATNPHTRRLQAAADAGEDDWSASQTAATGWLDQQLPPVGQAVGLAALYATRYADCAALIKAFRRNADAAVTAAAELAHLGPDSPLAGTHGLRFPLAQGPMTRVSDSASFCGEVADNGALPFLALALLRAEAVDTLLTQTAERLAGKPWGVGLLGFVPKELRDEQCAVIWKHKPPFALIAGGRPDQAAEFEAKGISTYIHAPTPALLSQYLEQGARKFVFEGRECGGHIGPLSSFALWEQMIERLLAEVPKGQDSGIQLLFAGGISNAISGAMLAAMTAPLAQRGMQVGALMGTAYLFTHEIIESGAVVPEFQAQALACAETVSLDSGPGHSTRCARTAFASDFLRTRQRLIADGRSKEEIRDALEALNLGRLRVASKGLERDTSGQLVEVQRERQINDGMYMIGQVATITERLQSLSQLHEDVCVQALSRLQELAPQRRRMTPKTTPADVAIVGIGSLLPGAESAEDYWDLIVQRIRSIGEVPKSRWDWELYYDEDRSARDKVYSRWGGFLDEVVFDPLRFGIPPRSMKFIDPMQLLTLEVSSRALADAGYADGGFEREHASIILGAGGGLGDLGIQYGVRAELPRFVEHLDESVWERLPEWTEESFAGSLLNVAAGRVANRLDFGGVNYTIDAACASSIAAISLALQELESGRSELVLAGGFDTVQSPFGFMSFSKTQALSPTGQPKTFDQAADGIAISEGLAVVALKRLADAERDGDRIYAVIKSAEGSSDGRALGLTAPRPEGQKRALRRAYARAGFTPDTVDLIEAHGTGTPVGDRAETETITGVLREHNAAPGSVAIGSVKTLIGHTKASAGVAGLIKVALALYHRTLPGHLGVEQPIAALSDPAAAVYLLKQARPWFAPKSHPRRAGVSAFGFGGTNFHAVLEEHAQQHGAAGANRWPAELFLFAAPDQDALIAQLQRTAEASKNSPGVSFAELARAVCAARQADTTARAGFAARNREELATSIQRLLAHLEDGAALPPNLHLDTTAELDADTAWLCPGQGSQYVDMGMEAALYLPHIRAALELADHELLEQLGGPLSRKMMPPAAFDEITAKAQRAALTDTRVAQPAIGSLSLGHKNLLLELGLSPTATGGHSYGEFSALNLAGCIDDAEFLRLSAARGAAMAAAAAEGEAGGMAAVVASREALESALQAHPQLSIANHNAPQQCVIAGPAAALQAACAKLREQDLQVTELPVAAAFHTRLVAAAQPELSKAIHASGISAPRCRVYSNVSGQPYADAPEDIIEQLDRHMLSSVEFVTQIENMYADGIRNFIELGPKSVCSRLVGSILGERPHRSVALDGGGSLQGLLGSLAALHVAGQKLGTEVLFQSRALAHHGLDALVAGIPAAEPSPHCWYVGGGSARALNDPKRQTGKRPALDLAQVRAAAQGRDAAAPAAQTAQASGAAPVVTPIAAAQQLPDSSTTATASTAISGDAFLAYQETMRQFLKLQEQVMQQAMQGQFTAPTIPQAPAAAISNAPAPEVDAAPRPAALPETQPAAVEAAASAPTQDLPALLLGIVAERTGYPPEMLDLDADLEADLGIDSIKRVEIVGALRRQLPEALSTAMKADIERYTGAPKLQAIVDALSQLAPQTAPASVTESAGDEARPDYSELLLSVVAEHTGYPPEMLELDANLEADLGIDSIKRVEIIGAFRKQLPDALSTQMKAGIETYTGAASLRVMIDALAALQPQGPQPAAANAAAPAESAPNSGADTDVPALLLSVVAEHTGYPPEMLELDANLEADLGIDSIKRVEIIGAFRKQLPEALSTQMKAGIETYTGAASLRVMINALAELQAADAPAAPHAEAAGKAPAPTESAVADPPDSNEAPRFLIKSQAAPLTNVPSAFSGTVLVMGCPQALQAPLFAALAETGAKPVALQATGQDQIRRQIQRIRDQEGAIAAILHLHGLNPVETTDLPTWQAVYATHLESLLYASQCCLDDLQQGRIISYSRLGGSFGRLSSGTGHPLAGAACGFLNCLRFELPDAHLRAVDINGLPETELVDTIVAELLSQDAHGEVGYHDQQRMATVTVAQPHETGPFSVSTEPSGDWVLLATGGARGITADVVEELLRPGMVLELTGRSPEPEPEAEDLAAAETTQQIRAALLERAAAAARKCTPAQIEAELRAVLAGREIRQRLQTMREAGATVHYHSCDARDPQAFAALIDDIYARHGRLDAVLHGAGVVEDKRVADKTPASLARVIGTKLDPVHTLLQKVRWPELKLMLFFSSVAGRYGNLGQADYGAANEALNRIALDLHHRWNQLRVLAINWGPWDAGMASAEIQAQFRARSIVPITVAAGRRFIARELLQGQGNAVEVVAGQGPWVAQAEAVHDQDDHSDNAQRQAEAGVHPRPR